jgi:hypothetical protein
MGRGRLEMILGAFLARSLRFHAACGHLLCPGGRGESVVTVLLGGNSDSLSVQPVWVPVAPPLTGADTCFTCS